MAPVSNFGTTTHVGHHYDYHGYDRDLDDEHDVTDAAVTELSPLNLCRPKCIEGDCCSNDSNSSHSSIMMTSSGDEDGTLPQHVMMKLQPRHDSEPVSVFRREQFSVNFYPIYTDFHPGCPPVRCFRYCK